MYDFTVKNVESHLLEADFVAITTDLWTSVANTDFLRQNVVAVVRDNARNIVAGLELSPFNRTACLAHTLQEKFLEQQNQQLRSFQALCTTLKVLKTCQISAGVAYHRLIQEEPTR
ncbi:hypothetical protein PR048_026698 [Dryococelus australis]|uniref:Uncharacterized protein n=1 Tax=Dryococelus australis TaxID=614101 RepID=A0ABQ9GM48_9NEOP|nr:hypothetical protein PR048_026698 [Dryococelus australis]